MLKSLISTCCRFSFYNRLKFTIFYKNFELSKNKDISPLFKGFRGKAMMIFFIFKARPVEKKMNEIEGNNVKNHDILL